MPAGKLFILSKKGILVPIGAMAELKGRDLTEKLSTEDNFIVMKQYIVGNWKMNGTLAEAKNLGNRLVECVKEAHSPLPHIIVCPPFPYLLPVQESIRGSLIQEGAQDCAAESKGSFTGDVSVPQLVDVGCHYVIIGHSERRQHHGETGSILRKKVQAALEGGLVPIFCLGERKEDYHNGKVFEVLSRELREGLPEDIKGKSFLIAYEPIWAIGTGLTPHPEEIEKVGSFLKKELGDASLPVLYGGSVTALNAADFLSLPSINGVLVGGASLKVDEFWGIVDSSRQ